MGELEDLVRWGKSKGIKLRGIAPRSLPGRGTGVVSTQRLKAGETILEVPMRNVRSLDSVPEAVSTRLPGDMPIHGLLATEIALDTMAGRVTPWHAVLPSLSDFRSAMPIMWPAELQALLPAQVGELVSAQRTRFDRAWSDVSAAFPELPQDTFRHAWLLVDSRSFLYETPRMEAFPWRDRMALVPVADMFNHAAEGCRVVFSSESYAYITRTSYRPGEEVHICYGQHSNDYLLAEYGFAMDRNPWDAVCLDDVILPRLSVEQRAVLAAADLLGRYAVSVNSEWFHRTETALRVMCSGKDEWQQVVGGKGDMKAGLDAREALFTELLGSLANKAKETLLEIHRLQVGEQDQVALLRLRWEQIEASATEALRSRRTK